jgi:hypothetical protein
LTIPCAVPEEEDGKVLWGLASTYPVEPNNRTNHPVSVKISVT